MSLLQRLDDMKPRESGLPCGVTRVMEKMADEDKKALEGYMFSAPRLLSNAQIQEALIAENYDITYSSISVHRRKQCRCFIGRQTRVEGSK